MTVRTIIIDGITVPTWAALELRQEYEPLQAVSRRRTSAGTAVQRELWSGKVKTVITGGGNAPTGLEDIDTSASYQISCIKPLARNSASNVIDIPATRRSDAGSEPFGFAIVGDELVPTAVSMNVNQATLTTVSGATGYQVRWFPILTVFSDPIKPDLARGSGFGWRLEAEEA